MALSAAGTASPHSWHDHEIGEVFVDKFGQYGYVNREAGFFNLNTLMT
jgi:hypothetical protein